MILSYRTQTSYVWYSRFFDALAKLEEQGTIVYPSVDFKRTISSKAAYARLLSDAGLPVCPTEVSANGEPRSALCGHVLLYLSAATSEFARSRRMLTIRSCLRRFLTVVTACHPMDRCCRNAWRRSFAQL